MGTNTFEAIMYTDCYISIRIHFTRMKNENKNERNNFHLLFPTIVQIDFYNYIHLLVYVLHPFPPNILNT